MAERGHEAKRLGLTLRDEPRSFPHEVLLLVRRSIRKIWNARGGGLYACGFVITFVFLETRMFLVDIVEADGVGAYFASQVTEIFFKYIGESIQNSISAFMWPLWFVDYRPPFGIGALVVMFLVFPRYLKAPLERWLFNDLQDGEPKA
jgi:hypothetical protein